MDSRDRDSLVGAAVFLVGALVLAFSYSAVGRHTVPGYDLVARFNRADGIGIGSDVRLSGVVVGKVVGQTLDDRFRAVVTMRLAPDIEVPDDSAALIQTDGLLGGKYLTLQPGASEVNLKPGETLRYSQDSMNVQELLELIVAQGDAKRTGQDKAGGAATPPQ